MKLKFPESSRDLYRALIFFIYIKIFNEDDNFFAGTRWEAPRCLSPYNDKDTQEKFLIFTYVVKKQEK